jgi:hypothetical protein
MLDKEKNDFFSLGHRGCQQVRSNWEYASYLCLDDKSKFSKKNFKIIVSKDIRLGTFMSSGDGLRDDISRII